MVITKTTDNNIPEELGHIQGFLDNPYEGVSVYRVIEPGHFPLAKNYQRTKKNQKISSELKGRSVKLIACNQVFVEQSGHDKESLFSQDIYSLYTLLGKEEGFTDIDLESIYYHKPRSAFLQWNRLDDKPNWIKCVVIPFHNQKTQYALAIWSDITPLIAQRQTAKHRHALENPFNKEAPFLNITSIAIQRLPEQEKIKAYVKVTFENCFIVHNLRIVQGEYGLFVAMPSRKIQGEYKDIAYPANNEFRLLLQKQVLDLYAKGEDLSSD